MSDTLSHLLQLVCSNERRDIDAFLDGLTSPFDIDACNDKGDSALLVACRRGDLDIIQTLIQRGANIHHTNAKGSTPLIASSMKGHLNVCQLLVSLGVDVDHCTNSDDSALSLAIWKNHTAVCTFLIQVGADIHHIDQFGDSALIDAAKHGNVTVMSALLARGTLNVNHVNKKGDSALIRAAQKGSADAVALLIASGANTAILNANGQSALHIAAMENHSRVTAILLEEMSEAQLKHVDDNGHSALFHMATWSPRTVTDHDEPDWTSMATLIRRGVPLDVPRDLSGILICRAANANRADLVQTLILHGADLKFRDENNKHRSALLAHLQSTANADIITQLIGAGADVNDVDDDGNTPLHLAIRQNVPPICRLLLELGADLLAPNADNETPLTLSKRLSERSECCAVMTVHLRQTRSLNDQLIVAAQYDDVEFITDLLAANAPANKAPMNVDVNYVDASGRSPLMYAAAAGGTRSVELLIAAGASPLLTDRSGCMAIMAALNNNHIATAKILARNIKPATPTTRQSASDSTALSLEMSRIADALTRIGREIIQFRNANDADANTVAAISTTT